MDKIKMCTNILQSKKLAKLLPLESADMYYWCADRYPKEDWIIEVGTPDNNYECICVWSLAALLSVLPKLHKLQHSENGYYCSLANYKCVTEAYNNPVDACYELTLKLNELNLL